MLQKSSISKTAEIFFISPTTPHYLMDISRKARLAHTSVKNNIDELIKQGIITKSIEKKASRKFPLYKANRENRLFKKYKLLYNITYIFESGIIEFIEEKLSPKSIILFGSYQKGEDTETSDIDLFIECKQEKLSLEKFEKILNRKLQLHFNPNFKSYPKELKNNIINGITLFGYLEGYT